MPTSQKIIVAVNKGLDPGRVLNAASHALLGLATTASDGNPAETFAVIDYATVDAAGFLASKLPLIVLQASPTHLRRLWNDLLTAHLPAVGFHESMTGGTWEDQISRSSAQRLEDLELYAVAAIGERAALDQLTKRCRLY